MLADRTNFVKMDGGIIIFEHTNNYCNQTERYWVPKWCNANEAAIIRNCKYLISNRRNNKKINSCTCGIQIEDLMTALRISKKEIHIYLKTIFESKIVRAVIRTCDKFVDDCWFTNYLLDVCHNLNRHPTQQEWSISTKLFCASVLYRVGTTNYEETLRGLGNINGATQVDLRNFNLPLPCSRTVKSTIPAVVWRDTFTSNDAKEYMDIVQKHPNHSTTKPAIIAVQTDATDLSKRICLGRDRKIYGHVDGPLTSVQFFVAEEKAGGDFKKEHFSGKAVVSVACDLSGNCTKPINYYFCHAETGENVANSANQIADELSNEGANIIHVMDAGSGNRAFNSKYIRNAKVHFCYVHSTKNGATHLETPKYYPVTTRSYPDTMYLKPLQVLRISAGGYNMATFSFAKSTQLNHKISVKVQSGSIEWKYLLNIDMIAQLDSTSDPGVYLNDSDNAVNLSIMRDDLCRFNGLTISNHADHPCVLLERHFHSVQAFGKKTFQALYNKNSYEYRRVAPIETINWTDKQSESVAAAICKDQYIQHIKSFPGTEALATYLTNL